MKSRGEKRQKNKNKKSHRHLKYNIKYFNLCIIGDTIIQKSKRGTEKIIEEVMAKSFFYKLMKTTNAQFLELRDSKRG